jgi:hypothetical protein
VRRGLSGQPPFLTYEGSVMCSVANDDFAKAFRQETCGRVVAMLSTSADVPEGVADRLSEAVYRVQPTSVDKPVIRFDLCLVMIVLGAVLTLVGFHLWEEFLRWRDEQEYEQEHAQEHAEDACDASYVEGNDEGNDEEDRESRYA